MKKRGLAFGCLFAGLLVVGGAVIIDVTSPKVEAFSFMGAIKSGLGKIKEKAMEQLGKIKSIAAALVRIAKAFNQKLQDLSFETQTFSITAQVQSGEESQEFGFDYDFGFEGGGDIEKGFDPVVAMFAPPIKIIPGVKTSLTAEQFLRIVKAVANVFKGIAKKVPGIPADLLFGGINKILDGMTYISRLKPETVFLVKTFTLFNSVARRKISFAEVPQYLTTLFLRLAISVNERATMKKYGYKEEKEIYEQKDMKTPSVFKDTGIKDIFDSAPGLVKKILDQIKLSVSKAEYDEWKAREKQKEPTEMQKAYGTMRLIARDSYSKATVYGLEKLLPLVNDKLSSADKELFVKAMVVHCSHRYQGVLKTFKGLEEEGGEEAAVEEGGEEEAL